MPRAARPRLGTASESLRRPTQPKPANAKTEAQPRRVEARQRTRMAPAEYLSGAWRLGLAAGYAALLAVNGVYGSGAFGVPTNADISGAYPSPVTPAGFTFAIWGPIFLGECLTMLLVTAADPGHPVFDVGAAIAAPWCAGTLCQVAWCGLFRPSVCGPGALWVPSAALGATAFFLGKAHAALQGLDLYAAGPLRGLRNDLLVRWPLALHFCLLYTLTLPTKA